MNNNAAIIDRDRFFDYKKLSEDYTLLKERDGGRVHGGLRIEGEFKCNKQSPLITVVIAVYNGENNLEETILSIINQTYTNVELIVVDGGSTDGTLEILEKYNSDIDYWVSESDKGISDAFNKAVLLASGDYISFQGDGDGFYNDRVLENIFSNLKARPALISGMIERIDESGNKLYISKYMRKFRKHSLLFRMSLPHQGLFTSMNFFKNYGLFDIENKFCMDYEILLRAYKNFPEVETLNLVVARWRADGLGTNQDLKIFKEYHKIKNDNNVSSFIVLKAINLWILIKYHVKKIVL